jgi:hypothetical protein
VDFSFSIVCALSNISVIYIEGKDKKSF